MLNQLVPAGQLSIRLFGDNAFERTRKVMKAVDEINARHGHDAIRVGVKRTNGHWATKFLRRSPRYTTCLKDALRIS